ncbi:hypothetical protein L3W99_26270, partial [Escherichia coli]|uniref:hypothetical protein n=1 Tax=Escherichia coli TaxID=562 RepID=UPI001F182CBE
TIGEGELMAHDVPLGCAPDEYDDLISGTCSHLPYDYDNYLSNHNISPRFMTEWALLNKSDFG